MKKLLEIVLLGYRILEMKLEIDEMFQGLVGYEERKRK